MKTSVGHAMLAMLGMPVVNEPSNCGDARSKSILKRKNARPRSSTPAAVVRLLKAETSLDPLHAPFKAQKMHAECGDSPDSHQSVA